MLSVVLQLCHFGLCTKGWHKKVVSDIWIAPVEGVALKIFVYILVTLFLVPHFHQD